MPTNYYLLLQVRPDASPGEIKQAFRNLSMRYHPDHAGMEHEERFLKLREAYETLSSPRRREEHDLALANAESRGGRSVWTALPPEPITHRPVNLFRSFQAHRPSLDEIADTMLRNYTGRGIPKSRPVRALNLELPLSSAEASRGGHVALEVPVPWVCPHCGGNGRTGFYACDGCGGRGVVWEDAPIEIILPRNLRDGETIPVSLRHLGIHNLYLNVHVRTAQASLWQ